MAPERLRLAITYQRLDRLRPYPKNAKLHPPEQIRMLIRSMQEVGFTAPILTDDAGMILAGHARWQAARQMEMLEVPTVILVGLTPDQKQAYIIADNRLAELGRMDEDILSMELGELQEVGFDLEAIGYTPSDVDDLLGEGALPAPSEDEDEDEEGPDVDATVHCPSCGFEIASPPESVKPSRPKGKRARA